MARTTRGKIRKILIANRGEIAIRVMRAAAELGIGTVAVYSKEDRFALHRFKADESYLVGEELGPIEAYLDIDDILRVATDAKVDAVHPGYGFLAENPDFAEACAKAGLIFVGPPADVMRRFGNKVEARALAVAAGAPVMPASDPLPDDDAKVKAIAADIGYPIMLKASWGGGGRGMRVLEGEADVTESVGAARREAAAAFGNDEVYLEKLVRNARHVEVQVIADTHGNVFHLFERDCTVQRRHQKVVERAPAPYLSEDQRRALYDAAIRIARQANYVNAGTVEFLQDADTGEIYFIEMNPRIQVEHTVTECVTGIDIVKAQIRIATGATLGTPECGVPAQDDVRLNGHALQCRVTTEDPEANFVPDQGHITAYRSASGFGIRLDAGTAFAGALITPHYDSLLVKVTSWGQTDEEAIARMDRALREFRIRGVSTNLRFLEAIINHPKFEKADYSTTFIDDTPELFRFPRRRDRATRLLTFIGDVIVNGNAEVRDRPKPRTAALPRVPECPVGAPPPGTRQILEDGGPKAVADWMLEQDRVLVTDTTFRDAHQSLLATRVRTHDILRVAPAYAVMLPKLFSVECWGGATFDVAMRFLHESPWDRLTLLREAMPNLLTQMLLRASNAVGYTNYPDNVVRHFTERAAEGGIDVFRVFDSLNWVDNMRVAIDAVLESGKICEAAICYAGDLTDPSRPKYDLQYYLDLAKRLEDTGAHILGIKDMAGLCRPEAARRLFSALKNQIAIPIHFHTHDTSGISGASVLAAIESGVDAVDAAMDSMSGLTSQPSLGAIVESLRHTPKDTGLDPDAVRALSAYWEEVRHLYTAFESDIRAATSEVYLHEMPGGQYTNLREQTRAMGLAERWTDVAHAYADVNRLFGDIIKVTPTSKVVGDMALMMVTGGLTADDVTDPEKEIAFPDSVVSLFRGDVGQPPGGFPGDLQRKVLKGEEPLTVRPGEVLPPADLAAERADAERAAGRHIDENDLASYLMYPKVFADFARVRRTYGDVGVLPTPVFFYGMTPGQEIAASIERGKTLVIRYLALGDPDEQGFRTVFFELNGQPRSVKVEDRSHTPARAAHPRADEDDPSHVGAPMPGTVVSVDVAVGQAVKRGDALLTIEAMKIESVARAERDGVVSEIVTAPGTEVAAGDLLIVLGDG